MLSKASSSYSLALSKMLEVFDHRRLGVTFSVVNVDNDAARMKQALDYAEGAGTELIFSVGSEATDYLSTHYANGRIPVVTVINKDPVLLGQIADYTGKRTGNIAYTSLNVPMEISLGYLKTLRPQLKAIGLLYDRAHRQVMQTEVEQTRQALTAAGVQVIDIFVDHPEQARAQLPERMTRGVAQLRAIDPTLNNVAFWLTSSTAIFSNIQMVNAHSGRIPVVANIPNAVGEGDDSAVLAIGIDRRSAAHLAALYGIRILTEGIAPGSLEVGIVSPPDIAINFRVARRIGLKIPFVLIENAGTIYGPAGNAVRDFGADTEHR